MYLATEFAFTESELFPVLPSVCESKVEFPEGTCEFELELEFEFTSELLFSFGASSSRKGRGEGVSMTEKERKGPWFKVPGVKL